MRSVSLSGVSYRFCFYTIKTAPLVLGLGWLLNMLVYRGHSSGYTSPAVLGLFVVYVLAGLVLGVMALCRRLVLNCPFCARRGVGYLAHGLKMKCPACGEIRGGGALRCKIVRDEMNGSEPMPAVPERKMQFRSPWFWVLFGVSVVSAVCGVVIHQFGVMTVFVPLWCLFVASLLIQALRTGCLNTAEGQTFRSRQPVKFWLHTTGLLLIYGMAVYLPIGLALQERGKIEAKTEVRAGRKAGLKR